MEQARSHFVTLSSSRGSITLPAEVRHRHHLDQPGAQVEIVERDDGVIELHPLLPHRADQAWFWTKRWQAME
ncbi:MAG: AbrB/MazE/SpoVT family DNA-binding domain-containing protein, partial [Streptosporangiaceae bacterium]